MNQNPISQAAKSCCEIGPLLSLKRGLIKAKSAFFNRIFEAENAQESNFKSS
jgi:hypothetical protein